MAQISGRALLGALRFAKAYPYPGGSAGLISRLPPEVQGAFSQRLRARQWYPYAAYAEILELLTRDLGGGHPEILEQYAAQSLREDAASFLKILSVFSSVDGLVSRGFGSWGAFLWSRHCDSGEVFLADKGDGFAAMGIREFTTGTPLHCHVTVGYLREMGRIVGAPGIQMTEVSCIHRGDSLCEFRGEW